MNAQIVFEAICAIPSIIGAVVWCYKSYYRLVSIDETNQQVVLILENMQNVLRDHEKRITTLERRRK